MTTSKSCGLKNSLCRNNDTGDLNGEATTANSLVERFTFVDGKTGLWTTGQTYGTARDNSTEHSIMCPVGGMVVFYYPTGTHDIVQVSDKEDWEACRNLDRATVLSPPVKLTEVPTGKSSDDDKVQTGTSSMKSKFPDVTYYYHCAEPGATAYLTCSVPGHCQAKQKVMIQTSSQEYAYDISTGNWTLHVDSLSRVLNLLGYRLDSNDVNGNGTIIMDRGYQTEEIANVTSELIWCALDHCPAFAQDFDPTIVTREECESIVFTLLGFVNRKRPIPQWGVAEDYYRKAIDQAGSTNTECVARSYLTQLFLTKNDWENATEAVGLMCLNCREESTLIQQARGEYRMLGIASADLDFDRICFEDMASSSAAPSLSLGRTTPWLVLGAFLHIMLLATKRPP